MVTLLITSVFVFGLLAIAIYLLAESREQIANYRVTFTAAARGLIFRFQACSVAEPNR